MEGFKKVIHWLDEHIEETLMAFLLAVIVVLIGVNVFMRYIMKSTLSWSDELARYCFIYLCFIGIGYAIKKDTTIKINILEAQIPKIKNVLCVIQDVFYLAFMIYMIGPAHRIVVNFQRHPQNSAAMQMPMQYLYVACIIGLSWAIFRMIQKYWLKIKNRKKSSASGEEAAA